MRKISFEDAAWGDYLFWQQNDKSILKKINLLIKEIVRSPFSGIGKPEPLKGSLSGFYSRRINSEHRIIYKIFDDAIVIVQCRYHY
jgi:toxin YoeB